MGGFPFKQNPIQQLCIKPFLFGALFVSPLTSCIHSRREPGKQLKDTQDRSGRVELEKSRPQGFLCTKDRVRLREGGEDKAGTSLPSWSRQWMPGAQEFMGDLRPVCNKKELK